MFMKLKFLYYFYLSFQLFSRRIQVDYVIYDNLSYNQAHSIFIFAQDIIE